jgi:hypothetical protein
MTTPAVIMSRASTSNTVITRWSSNERVVHAMLLQRELGLWCVMFGTHY